MRSSPTFALLLAAVVHAAPAAEANHASLAEIEAVRGVGPALAEAIVEARRAGAFRDWNDLIARVRGLGPGSAAKLSKAGLTVDGSGYAGPPSGPASAPRR